MQILSRSLLIAVLLALSNSAYSQTFSADEVINRTIVLSRAVHFSSPEGEDVLVPPGAYWVIPESAALELLAFENGDTFVIRAAKQEHTEGLTAETAVSTPGTDIQPDVHSIAFMFIDGTELVAEGTYSGIQPRGLLDDAKKQADAARRLAQQRAQEAKRRAQISAAQARQRAEQAAAEARQLAEQAAANIRSSAERLLNISCEDKLAALQKASNNLSATLNNLARQFPGREQQAQDALKELIRYTRGRNAGFFKEVYMLKLAAEKELDRVRTENLIKNGACGTNPEQTVAEFQRIMRVLQQSVDSQVTTRAAAQPTGPPDPIIGATVESVRRWRDGGFGTSVSLEALVGAGAGLGGVMAIGITGGYAGNSECPMPNVSGFCARNYFYRQLGVVTDVEANAGLAVGLWAVNPRNFNGLYTVVGGSVDTSVGPGVGADFIFDGNVRRYIECAIANGARNCFNQTALLGATVGVGVSTSLSPAEVHVQMGGEWTWWWQNGWVYDFQGPTPLWQVAANLLGL